MFKLVMKRWLSRHWRWFPLFAVSFVGGWQLWKAFLTNWVFWIGARTDTYHLGEISHPVVTGAIVSALFAASVSMFMAGRKKDIVAQDPFDLTTHFSWVTAFIFYLLGGLWLSMPWIKEKASVSTWFITFILGFVVLQTKPRALARGS